MTMPDVEPAEGGAKIVFDGLEAEAEQIASTIREAGFDVFRYYGDEAGLEHGLGGSVPGHVRLGAERPLQEFTDAEQAFIVSAFDAAQAEAGFTCIRVGVDVWTAGD